MIGPFRILIRPGIAYSEKKLYDHAISDFNRAIDLGPSDAEVYVYSNRGLVYSKKNRYDQAISDFNKAIKINPGTAELYINRGMVYFKLNQREHACSDWVKACDLGYCERLDQAQVKGYCPKTEKLSDITLYLNNLPFHEN
jgi:tetratricopeptide (TPR) repeat protein